jgi:hypothetical protein
MGGVCSTHGDEAYIYNESANVKIPASSSLLLAFASMVILGVEPHREP